MTLLKNHLKARGHMMQDWSTVELKQRENVGRKEETAVADSEL